jgi:ribonuclease Z
LKTGEDGLLELLFLGTAATLPSTKRNVSSCAVLLDEGIFLFDCGEGTQRQMMLAGISYMKVNWIALSHFHGDHVLGIPGIVQSMQLSGRERDLYIVGPEGLSVFLMSLREMRMLTNTFRIIPVELSGSTSFRFEKYSLTCGEAKHNVKCLAYRLQENDRPGRFNTEKAMKLGLTPGPAYSLLQKGKEITAGGRKITPEMVMGKPRAGPSVGYAIDTRPTREITRLVRGVDVLVFDSTFDSSLRSKARSTMHSTSAEAARVARNAGAGRLFLTHISGRYENDKLLRDEARKLFEKTFVARDFLHYRIRPSG